jgi:pyruvate formate lyase activating enzyme
MSHEPLIVDIKRHSLEDGPGIRGVAFFKGCPLRCVFCQNPEAQEPEVEIAFSAGKCIECGSCADACSHEAIGSAPAGRIIREKCVRCGRWYEPESLAAVLLRDLPFYRHSGGGVTLSGGECTLYPDYVQALLERLKERGVHVALETSGYFDYAAFEQKILPYSDLIYYDIKFADPDLHKKYTGKSNRKILANLRRLLRWEKSKIRPRVPLIPEITATGENLSAILDILSEMGAEDVSLLPYNPMGIDMTGCLGRPRPPLPAEFMKPEEEQRIFAVFEKMVNEKRESRFRLRPYFHS